jgi:pyruvate dehydrogenase E1 component
MPAGTRHGAEWDGPGATVNQAPSITLGISRFGQSGAIPAVCRHHCVESDSNIRAGLGLASR